MKKLYLFSLFFTCLTISAQQVTVTHRVDVTDYLSGGAALDPSGIRIAGNFATNGATTNGIALVDWTPTDAAGAMSDADGDNVWEITIEYPNPGDTVYYKFVNGDWGADESVTDTVCGGGGQFGSDRIFAIPSSSTGYTYCWAACTQCDGNPSIINNITTSNIVTISPNPAHENTNFNLTLNASGFVSINLFDITGKLIANVKNNFLSKGSHVIPYNTSKLNSGIYIYQIEHEKQLISGKLIIK